MDYSIFYKESFADGNLTSLVEYDFFLSAYDNCDRTKHVYSEIKAKSKLWFIFPHYKLIQSDLPDSIYFSNEYREDDYFLNFMENPPFDNTKKLCIDATGFIRPHLIFFLKYLQVLGFNKIDLLYTEPKRYINSDETTFSGFVDEVRIISGCESSLLNPNVENDLLIIGAGYDDNLITKVSQKKDCKHKYYIIGFPSLQPDMYQESILKISNAKESIGENVTHKYAPAFDPFITASILDEIIRDNPLATNIYLSPLSTKPQVLGFALYYIWNFRDKPLNILFPFSRHYSIKNAIGIKRTWRYTFEFPGN